MRYLRCWRRSNTSSQEQKTTEAEKAANASLKTIKKLQNDAEEKAKKFVDRTEEELNTEYVSPLTSSSTTPSYIIAAFSELTSHLQD